MIEMKSTGLSGLFRRTAIFLSIMGPGMITAFIDNDAGGIATCSVVGSHFGYTMLWTLIPLTISLIVIQEMAARMGAVTGKGLADLIRENYGVKATFYVMIGLLIGNIGTTVSEFAGIAAGLEMFNVSRYISVPLSGLFVWWIVTKGTYKNLEKVFMLSVFFFGSYVISAWLVHPPWKEVLTQLVVPKNITWDKHYIVMLVGLIGTTITPWMQFYLQSSVVEKGIRKDEYPMCRIDVIAGCGMTNIITFAIMVTCAATLFTHGLHIEDAQSAAYALKPIAGKYCFALFGLGLLNASLAAAAILPLSTAFYISEGLGWEAGVDRSFEEAPQFYTLFGVMIVVGAGFVLLPGMPLWRIMLLSQVIQGVLLPFILIFMLRLINKKQIMGTYVNSPFYNFIAITTCIVIMILTLLMVYVTLVK